MSVTEDRFEPVESEEDAFAHSLGVHQGVPQRIEIAFEPRIARYIRERVWHASQEIQDQGDGFALRSWILGFGALARVVSPPDLAAQISEEIEQARRRYQA